MVSLRKLIEQTVVAYEKDPSYNLLSCLVHGKPTPTYADETPIASSHIAAGEEWIRQHIHDFSYSEYRDNRFSRDALLKEFQSETIPYFKLQVFRVVIAIAGLRSEFQDDPLLKYIDEQFHVENDYLFYLDLAKFDTVPSFVVQSCEEFLKSRSLI